jgi:mannose/fructose-specific phosphotransferase system component IIA
MRAFILISHGPLAQSMKESVQMIAGVHANLFTASLSYDDSPESFAQKLAEIEPHLEVYKEIIIFSDLFGGSPGNTAVQRYINDPRVTLISGMNFPMLLTALLEAEAELPYLIQTGKDGIVDIKAVLATMTDDDE